MNWLLSLFPQFAALQRQLQLESEQKQDALESLHRLTGQHEALIEDYRAAVNERDHAVKSVANVFAQLAGHIPPYREAYSIERRPDATQGPVSTGRMYARDAVREGRSQFRRDLGLEPDDEPVAVEFN